jgi:diadenosine tetraphosphate (Ap4A) HIT family hydrolase
MPVTECPFCPPPEERVFWRGRHVLAIWDGFPVAAGHALLIPKRHVVTWNEASREEQAELLEALARARAAIELEHQPDGYNFGVNDGVAAGQSVMHLHMHVIPRYAGDVEDPRGGIRWVVKTPAGHWSPPE